MNSREQSKNVEAISAAAARWVARREAGLTATEQQDFECWLSADSRNAAALRHFDRAWSAFDLPPGAAVNDTLIKEVRNAVRRRSRRRVGFSAVLASLVVAVLWQGPMLPRATTVPPLVPGMVVIRPESRVLSDGTIVELRPGTVIAVEFGEAVRRVRLQSGEAHFQVQSDSARPFVVVARGVDVRAVGTAYAVRIEEAVVSVVVTEGRVAIDHENVPGTAEPTKHRRPYLTSTTDAPPALASAATGLKPTARTIAMVEAGNRAVVPLDTTEPQRPTITPVSGLELALSLAWRNARVEFSSTPLRDAVELMNRTGSSAKPRLAIDPASPGLADEPISGIFGADSTDSFVRMLELSLGVQAERRGEDEIILRRGG